MTAIKFRIRKEARNPASIKLILTEGRGKQFEVRTEYSINPQNWSFSKGMPKQNSVDSIDLVQKLKKLEDSIIVQSNEAKGEGYEINRKWITNTLDKYFNKAEVKNVNELKEQIKYILDHAGSRQIKGSNRIGLSKGRIQNYRSFLKIIEEYEEYSKSTIYLKKLSSSFTEAFKHWLLDYKEYSTNYAGKQLANLRAVARDAKKRGIEVSDHVNYIESFAENNLDRKIVTLSFDELSLIEKTEMPNNHLENAKNWLLLGCEIGQRSGDLLKLTSKHVRYIEDQPLIDLKQEKTGKEVTIPVVSKYVKHVIKENFPIKISQQKLNKYIKEVCELVGIDALHEGKIHDSTLNRKISGEFPKYKLITSHTFRRSFASNYYKKVATPILMTITGHSKESVFLNYINKQEDRDDNARLFLKYVEGMVKE